MIPQELIEEAEGNLESYEKQTLESMAAYATISTAFSLLAIAKMMNDGTTTNVVMSGQRFIPPQN